MITSSQLERVTAAWQPARDAGVVGSDDIEEIFVHAAGFVPAALRVRSQEPLECADLGTGAGIPGLGVALVLPHSRWKLVDGSLRRSQWATQGAIALDIADRARGVHSRAEELTPSLRGALDLVVARRFGQAPELAECGLPLLKPGGWLVCSAPQEGMGLWFEPPLSDIGVQARTSWTLGAWSYVGLQRSSKPLDSVPRRPAARKRKPWW